MIGKRIAEFRSTVIETLRLQLGHLHASRRDYPFRVVEVDLGPFGVPQLTWPDENTGRRLRWRMSISVSSMKCSIAHSWRAPGHGRNGEKRAMMKIREC
jgi:hypothetical protein